MNKSIHRATVRSNADYTHSCKHFLKSSLMQRVYVECLYFLQVLTIFRTRTFQILNQLLNVQRIYIWLKTTFQKELSFRNQIDRKQFFSALSANFCFGWVTHCFTLVEFKEYCPKKSLLLWKVFWQSRQQLMNFIFVFHNI